VQKQNATVAGRQLREHQFQLVIVDSKVGRVIAGGLFGQYLYGFGPTLAAVVGQNVPGRLVQPRKFSPGRNDVPTPPGGSKYVRSEIVCVV
jgi:hypothetical protein